MTVSREWLENYRDSVVKIRDENRAVLQSQLRQIDYSRSPAEVRRDVLNVMNTVCGASAQEAATVSVGWYDGLRERSTLGKPYGASAITDRNPQATEESVRAFLKKLFEDEDYDAFEELCLQRLDYETNRAAGQCVQENSRRDPRQVRYARVPTGAETCRFCIMLASRGFVYWSEESAGAFDHYHPHCDCMVVPSFDSMASDFGMGRRVSPTEVEGYDPDAYYDDYLRLIADPSFARSMANAADRAHAAHGRTRSGSRGRRDRSPQLTLTPQQVESVYARLNAAENDKVALGDVYLEIIRELMARPETTDADFTNIADHYAYLLKEYFRKHN